MAQQGNNNSQEKDKKTKVNCMGCALTLDTDQTGIICVNNHHICPECSKSYINAVFEDPAKQIPLKCMMCRAEVVQQTFERQLDDKQTQAFLLHDIQYNPKSYLSSDEIIASCPFCDYFEINTDDKGRLFFFCKKDECKKSSCFWCKKLIKNKENVNEEKVDMDETEVEIHFKCAQLYPDKQKWDKALADGNVRECPKCGTKGMKDNACTHMSCPKCREQWCYVCGLGLDKLDKANYSIYGHNEDWKTNPKRCPMYLDEIKQLDKRWPDAADQCVMFLHRLRGMELLKAVIKELGDDRYKALCEAYNVAKTCGFDMKEVMQDDHTLIVRQ